MPSRPLIIAFFCTALPLMLLRIDFWDGRLVEYAMQTGDMRGLAVWLFGDRWHSYYYFCAGLLPLLQATGMPYLLVAHMLSLLCMAGIAREVYLYGLRMFALPAEQARFAAVLALFFPPFHILASSSMFSYLACVWLVLMGYRLLSSYTLLGILLILPALNLNSNFSLLIGLALCDWYLAHSRSEYIPPAKKSAWLALCAASAAGFVALTLLVPKTGLHSEINKLYVPTDLTLYTSAIAHFAIWPLAITILALATPRKLKTQLLAVCILLFFIALPYVAVFKYPDITDRTDWSMRHGVLLVLPLCLFASFASGNRQLARILCLIAFAVPYFNAYTQSYERATREMAIIEQLRAQPAPPAGLVSLHVESMHHVIVRDYEVQWLLWKAYGRLDWLAEMNAGPADHSFILGKEANAGLADTPATRLSMLMPESPQLTCHTDISFVGGKITTTDTRCNGFK